jgi:hypothetical protein
MNRAELTAHLKGLEPSNASNIKFHKILISRLTEEDIPLDIASGIASVAEYDFGNVPEDNDSLSEFATEYAVYCSKVYKNIRLNGVREKDVHLLLRYFKIDKLEISGL